MKYFLTYIINAGLFLSLSCQPKTKIEKVGPEELTTEDKQGASAQSSVEKNEEEFFLWTTDDQPDLSGPLKINQITIAPLAKGTWKVGFLRFANSSNVGHVKLQAKRKGAICSESPSECLDIPEVNLQQLELPTMPGGTYSFTLTPCPKEDSTCDPAKSVTEDFYLPGNLDEHAKMSQLGRQKARAEGKIRAMASRATSILSTYVEESESCKKNAKNSRKVAGMRILAANFLNLGENLIEEALLGTGKEDSIIIIEPAGNEIILALQQNSKATLVQKLSHEPIVRNLTEAYNRIGFSDDNFAPTSLTLTTEENEEKVTVKDQIFSAAGKQLKSAISRFTKSTATPVDSIHLLGNSLLNVFTSRSQAASATTCIAEENAKRALESLKTELNNLHRQSDELNKLIIAEGGRQP